MVSPSKFQSGGIGGGKGSISAAAGETADRLRVKRAIRKRTERVSFFFMTGASKMCPINMILLN
jgi:hypothetical protein